MLHLRSRPARCSGLTVTTSIYGFMVNYWMEGCIKCPAKDEVLHDRRQAMYTTEELEGGSR